MVQAQTQYQAASLNPDDLGQGGLFDTVLTLKSAKFAHRDFDGGRNFGVVVEYIKEDGNVSEWSYSVGAADAWIPSEDGMSAIPTREGGKISANSAFGIFLKELVNAGFPKNRVSARLDSLFGVQFQSHSFTPSGTGMDGSARKGILAAKLVTLVPGEAVSGVNGTGSVPVPPSMPTPPTPSNPAVPTPPTTPSAPVAQSSGVDALGVALGIAQGLGDSFKLTDVMGQVMTQYANDKDTMDAVSGVIFTPQFSQMLTGAGYTVSGQNVSK